MIGILLVILLSLVLLLLLLMTYVYLVFRKFRKNLYENRKKAWLEKNREELQLYLFRGGEESSIISRRCRPVESFQFEAMEDFLSDFRSNFKTDPGLNPMEIFIKQYFVLRYRKRLFHSKWSIRMNTLYFIDLFQMDMLLDDLLKLLDDKKCSPEEQYQIYLLLADFKYEKLQDLFKTSKKIPPFLLIEMTSRLINAEHFESYADNFRDFPYEWQLSILDVFRDKNLRSLKLHELLEELLHDNDPEMRIRAAKTIASLGYISSPDIIVRIMDDNLRKEDWLKPKSIGEKTMLARLMGSIREERFLPYLQQFISDKGYIVRSEAAKAIRKYTNGKEILLSIITAHPDNYARNIAKEWLERSMDYE